MTAEPITLADLTDDERAEVEQMLTDNRSYGWLPVDRAKSYEPGVRIRHVGQRYWQAYENGTGVIVAVLKRSDAIELLVAYDEPRFAGGSRITQLGSYHVDLGPFGSVAR